MFPIEKSSLGNQSPIEKISKTAPVDMVQPVLRRRNLPKHVIGIATTALRPPSLRVSTNIEPSTKSETIVTDISNRLNNYTSEEIAYKVTELALRQKASVGEAEDTNLQNALGQMMLMMRMFEHLHVLKANPGS